MLDKMVLYLWRQPALWQLIYVTINFDIDNVLQWTLILVFSMIHLK